MYQIIIIFEDKMFLFADYFIQQETYQILTYYKNKNNNVPSLRLCVNVS